MDTNRSCIGVQKLSYLRAQFQGEARDFVAGFQLTSTSWNDSIQLLKERFGEPSRQTDAHMQAVIDLPGPNNTLPSLRQFYDASESQI